MNSIKRTIRTMLGYTGYGVLRLDYLRSVVLRNHLAALFDQLGIECVLDVGANIGQFRDFLRYEVGFAGLIVSFEPVARQYETMKARSHSDKQWIVRQVALGRAAETRQINVMKSGVLSSFLTPNHSVVGRFAGDNVVSYTEQIQVRPLDMVLQEFTDKVSLEHVYLKLDTQGYDLEVMGGAEEVMKRIPALQTEVSLRPIYEGMPSFRESYEALVSKGFDITGLFPVTRDTVGRVIEYDCVLVNSGLLDKS